MTVSDLKLKIFRQIDSLERNRLEELYGVLLNFLNEKKDISDWERLTEEQKQGIFDAIEGRSAATARWWRCCLYRRGGQAAPNTSPEGGKL